MTKKALPIALLLIAPSFTRADPDPGCIDACFTTFYDYVSNCEGHANGGTVWDYENCMRNADLTLQGCLAGCSNSTPNAYNNYWGY